MFKVQKLNASRMWINLMSGLGNEQQAIRYADQRARNSKEKIRVVCKKGSVVYLVG